MIDLIVGSEFTDAQNGEKYRIIDFEEFAPQKRTIRISANRVKEDGSGFLHKYTLFLTFPYMQFYSASPIRHPDIIHHYVSATNVPLNQANEFISLPLPNISMSGQILFNDEQPENAVVGFWQSAFSEEFQNNVQEFMDLNGVDQNHEMNVPVQLNALLHWQSKPTKFARDNTFALAHLMM
jgi:hypothetical protein